MESCLRLHLNNKNDLKTKHFFIGLLLLTTIVVFGQKDSIIEFSNISIDSMGDIKWSISYIESIRGGSQNIEHFENNKWIIVGGHSWSVSYKKGSPPYTTPIRVSNTDSVRVKFHKGINKYRITALIDNKKSTSTEFQLISKVSNENGELWISGSEIILDTKEYYEIINQSGAVLLKGENKKINISSLNNGSYFLYTKKATKTFTK